MADPGCRRRLVLGISSLTALLVLTMAPFFSSVTVLKVEPDHQPGSALSPGADLYMKECQRCHSGGGKSGLIDH
ncbi:MAG: hypothetical protein WC314_05845 [Vulcanimicrobiota bacterium]